MKHFCHISPDKEDLRVECKYRNEGTEHDWARKRDGYRHYDRAPFLKPETIQQGFYSEVLKGLSTACSSARKLWRLASSMRFQDGRILGFIHDLAHYTSMVLNQARNGARNTIEVLSYDRNKLQHKVKRAEPTVEERRSEHRSDMLGIMAQLMDLAQATHKVTKTMARYMEKIKGWLVSRDWSFARYHMRQTGENLTRLQYNLKPSYLEGEMGNVLDLLWIRTTMTCPSQQNRASYRQNVRTSYRRLSKKRTHREHRQGQQKPSPKICKKTPAFLPGMENV